MAEYTWTTTAGQAVARELLIAYLNTGTNESPVWSPLGKRVEDSSEEYDWSTESKKDILGDTYGTMKKPVITQSFERRRRTAAHLESRSCQTRRYGACGTGYADRSQLRRVCRALRIQHDRGNRSRRRGRRQCRYAYNCHFRRQTHYRQRHQGQ